MSGTANAAPFAPSGQNQRVVGHVPQNWRPRTGTIITGAAANKASRCARQVPGGTVNRVLKLSDGSYAVYMIKISWPHHVFVSKNFKVTRRHRVGAPACQREAPARPATA